MNRHLARGVGIMRGLGAAQWLALVLGLLLAMFLVVLLTESTSVGRGGR